VVELIAMVHYCIYIFILSGLLSVSVVAAAQDSVMTKKGYRVSKAAKALKNSLSNNDDDLHTAANYEALAKELTDKSEYAKAEDYLKKALEIYTRLSHPDAVTVGRTLAKVQEMQNKIIPAIQNYQ